MPPDIMTKADLSKGNDALEHLMKTGTIKLVEETEEMTARGKGMRNTNRSKAASKRELEQRFDENGV